MPCACAAGQCGTCACAKSGVACGDECHGGRGLEGNCSCLNFAEAFQTKKMPIKDVRKTLAASGMDVMGNKGELCRRLADHLREINGSTAAASAGAGKPSGSGGAARLIKAINEASEAGEDNAALLSLRCVIFLRRRVLYSLRYSPIPVGWQSALPRPPPRSGRPTSSSR